jgi:hypothetical protein
MKDGKSHSIIGKSLGFRSAQGVSRPKAKAKTRVSSIKTPSPNHNQTSTVVDGSRVLFHDI